MRSRSSCPRCEYRRSLFEAVCRLGYEGVIAKSRTSLYRPGERGWVKVKNPHYWRRDAEMQAVQRGGRRAAAFAPR
jgi:ATP-dependent DNA ligase